MNHLDVVMLTTATHNVKFVVQKQYKGTCVISISSNPTKLKFYTQNTAKFPTYSEEMECVLRIEFLM